MKLRGIVGVVVLALSASGCWVQAGFGPSKTANNAGETGITAANVDQLTVAWTATTGTNSALEAVIDRGLAFVRSNDRLTAFDLGTGALRWSTPVAGSSGGGFGTPGVPAIIDGWVRAPIAGQRCGIALISPDNGVTWGTDWTNGFDPALVGGGPLQALCKTGDVLAAEGRVIVPSSYLGSISAGGTYNGQNFCPSGGDYRVLSIGIHAAGAGQSPWSTTTSTSNCGAPPAPVGPDYMPMSLAGSDVVVAQGTTLAGYPIAGCSGCPPSWTVDVGGAISGTPIALDNGDIAAARADGQLVVVDGTSHAVEWTAAAGARASHVVADGTTIFVRTADLNVTQTQVVAFPLGGCGAATCAPAWATVAEGPVGGGRPSIAGDVLYVAVGRTVRAYDTAGCEAPPCAPRWTGTLATTSSITGVPAIHAGTVIVGQLNGTVTAFTLPD